MKTISPGRRPRSVFHSFSSPMWVLCASLLTLGGCGSSSSGSGDEDAAQEVALSLGNAIDNVELKAGQRKEIKFNYDIPGSITSQDNPRQSAPRSMTS